MIPVFKRGVLTDTLLDHLEGVLGGTAVLIGDGIAPVEGGWTGGEPGAGSFVPYSVVATGPAQRQSKDPIGHDSSSWLTSYTFRAVGGTRAQCDWTADLVREGMTGWKVKGLDLGSNWSIVQASFPNLGPVTRNDSVDPAYWEVVDNLSLWLEADPG